MLRRFHSGIIAGLVLVAQAASQSIPPVWPGPSHDWTKTPGQWVFLTEAKDAIVVYAPQGDQIGLGGWRYYIVSLRNQARPSVHVQFQQAGDGNMHYLYTILNGPDAKNPIGAFALVGYPDDQALALTHTHPSGDGEKSWRGWFARRLIARQVEFPQAPTGGYASWFHHMSRSLVQPGQALGGFRMLSSLRPGFTTAFIGSGKHWYSGQVWPEEAIPQLRFLGLPEWKDQVLLTLGPRYTRSKPLAQIAKEFEMGIELWMRNGRLMKHSPMLVQLRTALARVRSGQDGRFDTLRPTDEYEREVLDAVRISLQQ